MSHTRRTAVGALVAAMLGGTRPGVTLEAQEIPAAPAFTAQQLTALSGDGWLTNGGNLFNQRYSPLAQINRDNVKDVKAQWRTHLNSSGMGPQYSGQGQPLFRGGVLYVVTATNAAAVPEALPVVFAPGAPDLASGKVLLPFLRGLPWRDRARRSRG
jgi:glucose dehydrogenase